jgi:hypothetical protein
MPRRFQFSGEPAVIQDKTANLLADAQAFLEPIDIGVKDPVDSLFIV